MVVCASFECNFLNLAFQVKYLFLQLWLSSCFSEINFMAGYLEWTWRRKTCKERLPSIPAASEPGVLPACCGTSWQMQVEGWYPHYFCTSASSTTLCSAEPTCVQCSLSMDLVAQCIRKLWAPSIQAFHGLCNYCMRKKAVLIPSTLEGEVFTLALFFGNVVRCWLHCIREQRIRPVFHFFSWWWKISTFYGEEVTASSVNNCMYCEWPLK